MLQALLVTSKHKQSILLPALLSPRFLENINSLLSMAKGTFPPTLPPRPQDTEGGMDKWRDSNRALRIVSLGLWAAPAACCLHQPEKGQTEVGISRGAPPPAWFWFCLRLLRATLNHKKCPLWERLARGVCCRGSLANCAIWALAPATGRWYAGIARDTWKPTAAPS